MKHFFAGLGIGYGVALLLAPVSGAQTRRRILGSARSVGRRLHSAVPFGGRISSGVDSVRKTATQGFRHAADDIADLLNDVSKDDLLAVYGIGPVLADRIIRYRPYSSDREILEKDVLNEQTFRRLKQELLDRAS